MATKTNEVKRNAYEKITQEIIEALEDGVVAWQKPWKSNMPQNAVSGKDYRGINPFILGIHGAKYADHRWLTYKQATHLGGNVKKGEKGTTVTYWQFLPTIGEDGKVSNIPLMKTYTVFNVEQCENLVKLKSLESIKEVNPEKNPSMVAEEIWAGFTSAPEVKNGSSACYRPSTDEIFMPKRELFNSNEDYYATLFHEGAHATGHESRLKRSEVTNPTRFGSHNYSKEELVAEFTSAFLMSHAGMEAPTRENTVAYLQSWIKALNDDKMLLVKAASQAQKAADYILGITFAEAEAEVEQKELVTV
jgi:antirestriction protein ArdC